MKKSITVLLTVFFLAVTPAIAAAGRGYHNYNGYRGYYGGYSSGDVWAAAGIGLLTGVILSAIFTPPPPRTVVYQSTAPVVIQPTPVVVRQYGYSAPQASTRAVSVNVGELNVRSGPDLQQGIVGRVRYGEVLTVLGSAPGWLNVRTPFGGVGWVMAQYTISPMG